MIGCKNVLLWRLREPDRDRGKRGKRVVHNDTIDLHLQVMLQTVVNGGILVRGNWSYSSNDSDAVS